MLKIRMQRVGRINQPSFRIVVTEHARSTKAGKIVEKIGTYNPRTKARTLDEARVKYWISVGAQPSDTMHNMLISSGILSGKKVNVLPKKTVPKKEPAAAEAMADKEEPTPDVSSEVLAKEEAPAAEDSAAEVPVAEEAPAATE